MRIGPRGLLIVVHADSQQAIVHPLQLHVRRYRPWRRPKVVASGSFPVHETDRHSSLGAQCALRIPNFPAAESENLTSLHCKPGQAVHIEPGLRSQSPENGNISNIGRRLSAISLAETPIPEPGDR